MQQFIGATNSKRQKLRLPTWVLRIGIHTAPVIAGVVGRRKFAYDVWGDAVNIAARIETASMAGRINVSEAIYQRTRDLFEFEKRGSLEAKNKGQLEMSFLLRIKAGLAKDTDGVLPNDRFYLAAGMPTPVGSAA